jgi:hypothetical protein
MADHALRDAQRRYQESGSQEDRVILLRARVRAGAVSQARLELAAHLLDAAAIEVSEGVRAEAEDLRRRRLRIECDLRGWARALGRWGQESCVRAALAVGHLVHGPEPRSTLAATVTRFRETPLDEELVEAEAAALAAAEDWLACPCERHAAEAASAAQRVSDQRGQHPLARWRRAMVAGGAARALGGTPEDAAEQAAGIVAIAGLVWSPQAAARAVIDALQPWVSGAD